MATKLATQGLNVVLVALDEPLLTTAVCELAAAFPALRFRRVGVNLGVPGYLEPLAAATADLDVQLLFNNAVRNYGFHAKHIKKKTLICYGETTFPGLHGDRFF